MNEMTPQECAKILMNPNDYALGTLSKATRYSTTSLGKLSAGELVEVVRCSECRKWHTPDCHAGHEQCATDYCSHGMRKG
jgi:hypothetical protein